MMTSLGPTGFHPAMQPHPGVHPGHPMGAPVMTHNPSQPGAQPGMPPQMAHMGVSGQVTPGMIVGAPQGAGGPNAHSLGHLNPSMFQQQPQYMGQNPAMNPNAVLAYQQQQQHQQRLIQQRQAMLQQQMYGSMPINLQNMNAAQFQQMRQNGMQPRMQGHMPQAHLAQGGQHPNQIMAQQLAMQQQQQHHAQQAANNAMHQGGQPGHPGNMAAHQLQNMQQSQLAQSMAQQMPSTVAQNQPPQNQPQPQPQAQPQAQGQQPQQPQQPPQTPQQGQQQQAQPQAQQAPTPQQGPQRAATPASSQGNQGQPQGPNAAPPNQTQQQQPGQQGQTQNAQAAQPQQANAQLSQQQQMNLQQFQQAQAAVHAQAQAQAQQHRGESAMKGQCLLKLAQFSEHLSAFPGTKSKDDVSYWHAFVSTFFSPRGVFRITLPVTGADPTNEDHGTDKQYEIVQPALARFFHTHFQSGIERIQLSFEKVTQERPLQNGGHFVENPRANMVYWFDHSHVVTTGHLKAQFDSELKLDFFEFITQKHEEYVSRRMVINAAMPTHLWTKEWKKVNGQDANASPEISKKTKTKLMKSPPNPPPDFNIPHSAVKGNMGITEPVFQFLEIVEVMGQMSPLFHYYQSHPSLSPYQALEQYVNTHVTGGQQAVMNGHPAGNIPPNQRAQNFGQFPMGASPAAQHLQLPNSPHMGSPAQGHMQAPGMQLQQSQQGTSSSGPSANTSPASNKRRRPSTVKAEEESGAPTPASIGGAQVNGVANKKPPTPRMQKRQKVNAP